MKKVFLLLLFVCAIITTVTAQKAKITYACLPCGSDCDAQIYTKPGTCRHCHMKLVKRTSIQFKNLSQNEACTALADTNTIALDVRTAEEFNGTDEEKFGRIKNAYNIPLGELQQRIGELNSLKDKHIIVYCSHSHRSPQAAWLLSQNGFNVSNLKGGMAAWKNTTACKEWLVPQ